MSAYEAFLASKAARAVPCGIGDPPALSPKLKEHQRLLTRWALKRGRAAIYASTGLGKGWMILEFMRVAAEHTGRPSLILAPLAVSQQFAREAEKLGVPLTVCASQADVRPGTNVTNYQKLHHFDASAFGAVALDEASLLKSLDGKTRVALIDAFRDTPFRLAATATPAPNDHVELGGQAEFLGVMKHAEMLATFFVHDGGSVQDWRLKGHAREQFFSWVCSWGAIVNLPSDIDCDDTGYILPPLRYHEHIIPASLEDTKASGFLFSQAAETLNDQRAARRGTLSARVTKAAEIINGDTRPAIAWCDLNVESEALTKAMPDAIEVTGSMSDDEKEANLEAFVAGKYRVLVSKPSLAGFGLNLQFVRCNVFCGVTHSFEAFFQAVRRSWRFGVDGEVDVHVVSSELEGRVVDNLKRKMAVAAEMAAETRRHASAYVRAEVTSSIRETLPYEPAKTLSLPSWLGGVAAEEEAQQREAEGPNMSEATKDPRWPIAPTPSGEALIQEMVAHLILDGDVLVKGLGEMKPGSEKWMHSMLAAAHHRLSVIYLERAHKAADAELAGLEKR